MRVTIMILEFSIIIQFLTFQVRETVDNDNDIIHEENNTGEIEDIVLDGEGNVDVGLNI